MKLSKSIRRVAQYAQGGLTLAIAVSTLNEKGLRNVIVEREPDPDNPGRERIKSISLRPGATIHRLEFEDDQASYNDSTQFGNNTYPKHSIGFKFAGKSPELDAFSIVADLTRTTHICQTRMGHNVILGADNGMKNEKNESGSGAAGGDFNGYDMVISGAEKRKAELIPDAVFETLLALVDEPAADGE